MVEYLWEVWGREHYVLCLVEHDVFAIVVLDDARIDILATGIWCSIHVGNEPDDRHVGLVGIGRKGGIYIAIVVDGHIRKSDADELLVKLLGEGHLTWGARSHLGGLVACRLYLDVRQKTFD